MHHKTAAPEDSINLFKPCYDFFRTAHLEKSIANRRINLKNIT